MKTSILGLSAALLFVSPQARADKLEIAVIVDSENPVGPMNVQNLRAFFLKQKKSWPSGKTVVPLQGAPAGRERQLFIGKILQMSEAKADSYWIERKQMEGDYPPQEIPTDKSMIMMVDVVDGAVGYVNRQSLNAEALQKVKVIAVLAE